jgi:hypothetical protein
VRLCLIREIESVCGGEIKGGGSVVRFCSKPRDMCDIASHAKSKTNIKRSCLYPYVPKKGTNQVRLEPSLSLSLVPQDETLDMLLLEEKSVSLWRTYMEACQASELLTGRNELGTLGRDTPNWNEDMEAPNLQDLVNADDFKTPKKVRVIANFKREEDEDYVEVVEIGTVSPLNIDLTGLSPLEGASKTSSNLALRRMLLEWDGLARKFGNLKSRFLAHEAMTGQTRDNVVAQFVECNFFMNELGNKARLLASRIGIDERPDQAEASVWETLNILQEEVNYGLEEVKVIREEMMDPTVKVDMNQMGKNLEKLAKSYRKTTSAFNSRILPVEDKVTKLPQEDHDDQFDFNPVLSFDANARADVDGCLRKMQDRTQVLEESSRTQVLEESSRAQGGISEETRWGESQAGGGISSDTPPSDTANHESILGRLEILESRATDETCIFGGFHFSTIHDVITFVTKFGVPTCAMYWDMLSAMRPCWGF